MYLLLYVKLHTFLFLLCINDSCEFFMWLISNSALWLFMDCFFFFRNKMCFHSIFFVPAKFGNNQTKVPVDYLQHSKPNTKKNGDKCLPMLKMKWCYIFSDLWQIRENCARYDKWLAATTERCTYIYYLFPSKKKETKRKNNAAPWDAFARNE